ncbi:MAG: hypothetical protein JWQ81_8707 [Amycolatopsis sp.]|uniref:hypothetical protein n=1 Tax=Amycolatopsis sp. TaxID=37632 RepID=UPI00261EAA2D|nr:hypothetical protein [Amycolatopsis sp.]MCU1687968.1 hypothetical protein [Amycolatopsis sp.]
MTGIRERETADRVVTAASDLIPTQSTAADSILERVRREPEFELEPTIVLGRE